jgi:hypothetical protein
MIASKHLFTSTTRPSVLLQQGFENFKKFIEIIDTDLVDIQKYGTENQGSVL